MPKPLLDDFLSRDQLAKELGKSRCSVTRWERLGVGPPIVRIGGTPLYRRSTVEAWLADQEKKQAPKGAPALRDAG